MSCSVEYNGQIFTEEDFKAYIEANYPDFEQFVDGQQPPINMAEVQYQLKSVQILDSPKAEEVFSKGSKNSWNLEKILTELQIPKNQKELLLSLGTSDRNELLTTLLSQYSYVVEVETTRDKNFFSSYDNQRDWNLGGPQPEGELPYVVMNSHTGETIEGFNTMEEANARAIELNQSNATLSSHYSNMTVGGGINYTENEIKTPAIVPIIKGHAQFASDNGVGWFRSDDQVNGGTFYKGGVFEGEMISSTTEGGLKTKTRRILEVQSDLFQKGRNREELTNRDDGADIKFSTDYADYIISKNYVLITHESGYNEKISTRDIPGRDDEDLMRSKIKEYADSSGFNKKEDQFLQLLNKDNNWINFFVKSIIQDSSKRGYEQVLFPVGDTAAKIEGHGTIAEFIASKEASIKELESSLNSDAKLEIIEENDNSGKYYRLYDPTTKTSLNGTHLSKEVAQANINDRIKRNQNELAQLQREVENARAGTLKISSIANFYENTVFNVLQKRGYNPTRITDEHGNGWYQVKITPSYSDTITLDTSISAQDVEDRIRQLYKPFTHSTWEDGTIQLNGKSNQLNRGRIAEQLKKEFNLPTLKGGLVFSEKQSQKGIKYRTIGINKEEISRLLAPQITIFDTSISDLETALKEVSKDQTKFNAQIERLLAESDKVQKVVGQVKEESVRSALRDALRYLKKDKTEVKNFVYFLVESNEVLKHYAEQLKQIQFVLDDEAVRQLDNADIISRSLADTITFLKKDFRYVDDSNEFKKLVDDMSSHYDQIQNIYASEAEVRGVNVLTQELAPDVKIAFDKLNADLTKSQAAIDAATRAGAKPSYINTLKANADKIKKKIIALVPDSQNIEDTFKGLRGDLHWLSGNARSALAMGDPVVSGYARRLKQGYNIVRSKLNPLRNQAQDALGEYVRETGVNPRMSMGKFYEGLFHQQKIKTYDKDGKESEDSYYSLLGPINQSFYNDENDFKENIKKAKVEGDIKKIEAAQKAYSDWLAKNAERQYSSEWYERFDLLTPEAYDARQEYIDEINSILKGPNRDSLSDEDLELVNTFKYKLKRLGSLRDDNHQLKTGKDLEIAQSIQAFNKRTAEMSYWETTPENKRWYDIIVNKKKDQVEKGIITQKDFDQWFQANTQKTYSQEYYKQRQLIIDKIQAIMSKLPEQQFKGDIKKLWDVILDVSRPFRDEDNTLIGNNFSPEGVDIIRSSEESIEEIKSKLIKFSGLTMDEEMELKGLWGTLDTLTPEEIRRFSELRDQSEAYKEYLGSYISKTDLAVLMTAFGELAAISKYEPTTYYTDTYKQKLHEFQAEVDPNNLKQLSEIEEMFKNKSQWYKDNHITRTKKTYDEGKTTFTEVDEPLYIWKEIMPTNEDWIDEAAPGFAFKTRIIKPEFINSNYQALNYEYFRAFEQEEFRTVPKRTIDGKLSSYMNEDYERLKNYSSKKDKARWDMLQFLINTHLSGQQALPKYKKLDYFLPGAVKDRYDRFADQGLKGVKKSIFDTFNVTQTDRDLVLGDLSQVDLSIVPIKYSTKVKPENQDFDLLGIIMKHRAGIEEYSYLQNELPYAKIIQSALKTAPKDVPQSSVDRVLKTLGFDRFVKASKESLRSRAYESFVRTMFYGETQVSPFNSEKANKIINSAFGLASLQVMTFNFPAHITNILSGEVQNVIEAFAGKYMTFNDYRKAKQLYAANVGNFWKDYTKEGNKTFWTELAERLDVPQGEYLDQYGSKTNYSRLRDGKNIIMFIKQGGEHEIQVSAMMAMSLNQKVKMGDKMVSLNEALQLKDGHIVIRPGVQKADGTEFTEADLNIFQNKVHAVLRQLNGAYSKIDKSMAEKSFLGKLAFYMRKYFMPMAYRRFEDFKYDYEEQDFKEGYYRTAAKVLYDVFKLNKDLVNNWGTYTSTLNQAQKRNLRRFMGEVLILAALATTIFAIGGYDDDRDLKGRWWHTMALYELMKMKSETETLLPGPGINEMSSIFSSPFVPATTAKTVGKILFDTFGAITGNESARFKIDYGPWSEGDLRVKADVLKLLGVPVNFFWSPDSMVKNFELRNR